MRDPVTVTRGSASRRQSCLPGRHPKPRPTNQWRALRAVAERYDAARAKETTTMSDTTDDDEAFARRDADLKRWRDLMLWVHHKDEAALGRLAPEGRGVEAAIDAALAITPPTDEEIGSVGLDGFPLDPEHPAWGYSTWAQYEAFLKAEGRS